VNFDWRMGTSWLGWLVCQKVLLLAVSIYGELTFRQGGCLTVDVSRKIFQAVAGLYCDHCLGRILRLGYGANRHMSRNVTAALKATRDFRKQKVHVANV
jgi:hypothetical protein